MPDPGENLIDRRGRGNLKRHAREEIRQRRSASICPSPAGHAAWDCGGFGRDRPRAAQTGPRGAQPDLADGVHAATPIPAPPSLGQGKDRALVLGGGEYFIAWLLGFAHGLHAAGVSYDLADVIVGTSAGAMVGSAVAGERLGFLRDDIDFFGLVPKLLADLIPTRASNPSQVRAREVAEATTMPASPRSNQSAAAPWRPAQPIADPGRPEHAGQRHAALVENKMRASANVIHPRSPGGNAEKERASVASVVPSSFVASGGVAGYVPNSHANRLIILILEVSF